MKKMIKTLAISCCILATTALQVNANSKVLKPTPDAVVQMMKEGNARFVANKSTNPHVDSARLILAGSNDNRNLTTCAN